MTPFGAGPERSLWHQAAAARGVTICNMTTGDHLTALLAAADEEFADAGFRTGDFSRVRELLAEALAGAEQAGDLAGRARALDLLAMVAHYDNITKLMSGDRVPAQEIDAEEHLFRQALAAWHAAGQRPATAQALFGLGLVYQVLHSDWTSAMPYFWQALELVEGTTPAPACTCGRRYTGTLASTSSSPISSLPRRSGICSSRWTSASNSVTRAGSLPGRSRWRRRN